MTLGGAGRWLFVGVAAAVIAAVLAAVFIIGSPAENRKERLDAVRIEELQAIQRQIDNYAKVHRLLPETLDALAREPGYSFPRIDPESGASYEYRRLSADTYRLCASFETSTYRPLTSTGQSYDKTWAHHVGTQCFDRAANVGASDASGGQSQSAFVIIDRGHDSFVVFTGVAKNAPAAQLDRIEAEVAKRPRYRLVTWGEFTSGIRAIAKTVVLRNDYPKFHVTDGLVCLVSRRPGWKWGLTWNGGIALTANDYRHVESSYRLYKQNPVEYRPIRDPRADPVNPGGVLPAFGCM